MKLSFKNIKYYQPSLWSCFKIVLVLALGGVIVSILIGLIPRLFASSDFFLWKCQSFSYLMMMLPPFLYIAFCSDSAAKREIRPIKVNEPDYGKINPILFYCLLALGVLSLGVIIEPISLLIPMSDRWKGIFESAFMETNIIDSLLSVAILAPLCEEMMCRGVMLRGLLQHTTPTKAILWSALIFALIHLNPWQAIPAFIIGAFFGWIYSRTHSIWAVIFMHCVNNTNSTILSRSFPDLEMDQGLMDIMNPTCYAIVYTVSLAIVVLLIFMLNKFLPKRRCFINKNKDEQVISA